MKKFLGGFLVFLVLTAAGTAFVKFYSYIFSRTVIGVIQSAERIETPIALVGGSREVPTKELFSFAIAIKESSGEIVTASSEDRQWAVVQVGQCAEARYYPYPFWELDKSGTYYGARLIKLSDCAKTEETK